MGIAIQKLFAQLLFWLYDFLNAIFECFQVLCGIQPVGVDGGELSLIDVFLQHETVTQVFLSIFLLSIIIAAVCTCVSITKSIINMKGGERKSHAKSLGQGFGAIITSLLMVVVMLSFISMSNSALGYIQHSFNSSYDNMSFSSMLFDMSVEYSYQYDYDNPQVTWVTQIDPDTGEILYDENGDPLMEIDKDADGNVIFHYEYICDENGDPILFSGYRDGYSAADLDFGIMNPDTVFGVHEKGFLGLFEDSTQGYTRQPMVEMESFNFWTAYLVVVVMLIAIIWSMLGLVKRIFDITFLFLAMPLITATIPLDEGARFKTWRDTVISKVILSWGAVFSINVFLLLIPIINQIDFAGLALSETGVTIFKIFLMMGGALAINGGQLLAARLMGADASESREMTQSARALLGGAMAGGGLVRGAKNMVFGGQNKYGRYRQGLLSLGARGANSMGERIGGQSFSSSHVAGALRRIGRVQSVPGALRGNSHQDVTGKNSGNSPLSAKIGADSIPNNPIENIKNNSRDGNAAFTSSRSNNNANAGALAGSPPANVTQQNTTQQIGNSQQPKTRESNVQNLVGNVTTPKNGNNGAFKPPKKGGKK